MSYRALVRPCQDLNLIFRQLPALYHKFVGFTSQGARYARMVLMMIRGIRVQVSKAMLSYSATEPFRTLAGLEPAYIGPLPIA